MSAATIPLPEIVKRLSAKVGCNEDTSGAFLKEFSIVVAQGLATDGSVRIDGLGTFRVTTDMDGKPTVDFAPDALMAETVNEPFAMFESVELADTLDAEELDCQVDTYAVGEAESVAVDSAEGEENILVQAEKPKEEVEKVEVVENVPPPLPPRFTNRNNMESRHEPESDSSATKEVEAAQDSKAIPVTPEPEAQSSVAPAPESEEHENVAEPMSGSTERQTAATPQPVAASGHLTYDAPVAVRLEPESRVTIKRVGHTTLTLVVTAIAACLLGVMAGYMAYRYANFGLPGNVEVVEEGILIRHGSRNLDTAARAVVSCDPAEADSTMAAPRDTSLAMSPDTVASTAQTVAPPQPEVVTDTVRPGNYLSVMARRHYGNAKFWVYIYMENKNLIQDPDNLENGMVLVIPPASKYDIDPSSKESLRKADREAYKAMSE